MLHLNTLMMINPHSKILINMMRYINMILKQILPFINLQLLHLLRQLTHLLLHLLKRLRLRLGLLHNFIDLPHFLNKHSFQLQKVIVPQLLKVKIILVS